MTTYVLRRGPGSLRRSAHYAEFDRFGNVAGAWCKRPVNMSSNVPWGRPRCKDCERLMRKAPSMSMFEARLTGSLNA